MQTDENLYSVTGAVQDINTILVPKRELEALRADRAALDWLDKGVSGETLHLGDRWYVREGAGFPYLRVSSLRQAFIMAMRWAAQRHGA